MTCNTLTIGNTKERYKFKKPYDTLDKAIAEAKKQNLLDDHTHKLVGYKCTYCFKYHIGRNGTLLTEKDKVKLKAEAVANQKHMKVVGWIDLSKIRY